MARCGKVQPLLAQSLYEGLGESEQRKLDAHLASCSECRQEHEAMALLVKRIPVQPIVLNHDIMPALRARLREAASIPIFTPVRLAWSAASLCAIILVAVTLALTSQSKVQPDLRASENKPVPKIRSVLHRVDALLANHDYTGAYLALSRTLEVGIDEALASDVTQRMADLAYEELRWYPEAYAGYDALRLDYNAAFRSSTRNVHRLNLLDEARGPHDDYASLYAIDAARRSGSFDKLEAVVSRYPATYMASLAASEMAALVREEEGLSAREGSQVLAMELSLKRCTDPIAISQLKIETGHLLREQGDSVDRARSLYEDVAEGGSPVLAQLARESLRNLEPL